MNNNRRIVAYGFEQEIHVKRSNDYLGRTTFVVGSLWVLAIFGHQAAGHPVVVVLTDLWFVGATFVRTAGQRQGCFANTRTVYPLQRQANADYQQVEREPGGKPPCEFTKVHGAKLRARSLRCKHLSMNTVLMV